MELFYHNEEGIHTQRANCVQFIFVDVKNLVYDVSNRVSEKEIERNRFVVSPIVYVVGAQRAEIEKERERNRENKCIRIMGEF